MKSKGLQVDVDEIYSPDNAWLQLPPGLSDDYFKSPFKDKYDTIDSLEKDLGRILINPDYIPFTMKHILNMEYMPFQTAALRLMWDKPFPMFIASRGASKTLKDAYIIRDDGFYWINDLFEKSAFETQLDCNFRLLGESGFRKPDYSWKKRPCKTIKLTTRFGFNIEGSEDHPIRVVRDGQIEWIKMSDLRLGDYTIIDRNANNEWPTKTNDLEPDVGYLLGCLVGDGGYTIRGRVTFTTADLEFFDHLNTTTEKLWSKSFKKIPSSKYDYIIYSVDVWDQLFQKYGFNSSVCGEKDIPASILKASKNTIAAFIRGLFDTDGGICSNKLIQFCSKSPRLAYGVQFLLSRFGIISKVKARLNKKYNIVYYYLYITGNNIDIYNQEIGFNLSRKQDLLNRLCLSQRNTNVDILPHDLVLDKLLKLRDVVRDRYTLSNGHGYSYVRQLVTPYRFKKYQLSYTTLKKILDVFGQFDDIVVLSDYQDLVDIYNKRYFYDQVEKLESGFSELYDFYIPEDHSFISGGFISHNSFCLAIYCILKSVLVPNCKIVIAGAALRQSKFVFDYMVNIWDKAPILQDICSGDSGPKVHTDKCIFHINGSTTTAIPIGDGAKIRGMRAGIIIAEEFASQSPTVYEVVVAGFGAVSTNPIENAKMAAKRKALMDRNMWTDELESLYSLKGYNQAIISGTADYDFKHFAQYWKNYKKYIESGGDRRKLQEIFGGEEVPEGFSHKDFAVIRLPYELLPKDFMEEKTIARAKATMNSSIYKQEYQCIFVKDSDGFFKRSLIERCVVSDDNPIHGEIFDPMIVGDSTKKYVFGVDPASERDNFSIVVIELNPDHNRVVYCWTTRKDEWSKNKRGEQDFYAFCCRKIRNLMRVFPCVGIGLDKQGGGIAVEQALHNDKNLETGEKLIWPVVDPDKPQDSDHEEGWHILHIIQFAQAAWVSESNHDLRFDLESRYLLFPRYDPILLGTAGISENNQLEKVKDWYFDSFENTVLEIEEMKNELSTIIMTMTGSGPQAREHFDTPEGLSPLKKKGNLFRKDRYSALLIANSIARKIAKAAPAANFNVLGGSTRDFAFGKKEEKEDKKAFTGKAALFKDITIDMLGPIRR